MNCRIPHILKQRKLCHSQARGLISIPENIVKKFKCIYKRGINKRRNKNTNFTILFLLSRKAAADIQYVKTCKLPAGNLGENRRVRGKRCSTI